MHSFATVYKDKGKKAPPSIIVSALKPRLSHVSEDQPPSDSEQIEKVMSPEAAGGEQWKNVDNLRTLSCKHSSVPVL